VLNKTWEGQTEERKLDIKRGGNGTKKKRRKPDIKEKNTTSFVPAKSQVYFI